MLFLLGQPLGRPELHAHVQVTRAAGIDARQASPAQVELLPALRSGGNRQHHGAGDGRDGNLAAKHQLRIRHQHFRVQVFTVAVEARIFGNVEHYVHVAARTAANAGIAHPP